MAVLPNGNVLLFGGQDSSGKALDDCWVMDTAVAVQVSSPASGLLTSLLSSILRFFPFSESNPPLPEDWTPITPPDSPSARQGHSMATLPDGRVILFGGTDNQGAWFNDLHVFADNKWSPLNPESASSPAGRYGQHIWTYNGKLYIQGGISKAPNGDMTLNEDLWLFDLQSKEWEKLQNPPSFTSPNASPFISGNKAYLIDPHRFDSSNGTVNVYDMDQKRWEQLKLSGDWPHGERSAYTMVQVGTSVYMWGGSIWNPNTQSAANTTETWVMDLNTLTWKQLQNIPSPVNNGKAVYDSKGKRIVSWGGAESGKSYVPGNRVLFYNFDSK
jgi:N-acetylneuraminic acid mutarotase